MKKVYAITNKYGAIEVICDKKHLKAACEYLWGINFGSITEIDLNSLDVTDNATHIQIEDVLSED